MKAILLASLTLTASTFAHAFPVEVFDASTQCVSRMTSTGERFVPPCNFSDMNVYSEQNTYHSNSLIVRSGLFKTALNYNFVCESIRPLSIRYTLSAGAGASSSNRISGSRSDESNTIELTHGFTNATLNFANLEGATGFQAIKPGCNLAVQQLLTYPEPRYFNQLATHLVSYNNQMKTLISIAIPSTNHISLINTIDNSLATLEILQFDIEDDFLLDTVQATMTELTAAKSHLTRNCSVGSNSALCTAEIANLRSVISNSLIINENNISELHNFLNEQVSWLSGRPLGRDLLILSNGLNKLKSQL
ncbi:hypothetical protein [Pseudoalteromonas tunicata]|uniref:Orphan protein n=1 Tax=Pseudoalteromonas tunicata D2 TaxID=87626 RepID=A4CF82_9GAMM|nr:hypothetical protein [Pseudoalteromonas tunicata]ATC96212.1 hypothetical protein PTUN_a3965 [Pseudoalteromonas tunicata]AXT31728.1 hypothetical protein D1819_13455 [Pseudoalteromonas tunicata]EAR26630.1 hypothetical protein PTD2_00437 [Pseudoalteromonas tunicata D2]MDP4985601.1 hypothetical protein [Pseudoalteromonas tunicata]MDP5214587.1 hypothetical protein [Pseudoalteromonas tunicata]